MPELLGRATPMPVEQVKDETPVQPNHVYVIPPNAVLTIDDGVLRVRTPTETRAAARRSTRSSARSPRTRGTTRSASSSPAPGTDGTLGLQGGQGARRPDHGPGAGVGPLRQHAAQRDRHGRGGPRAAGGGDAGQAARARAAYLRDAAQGRRTGCARGGRAARPHLPRSCAAGPATTSASYKQSTLVRRIRRRMQRAAGRSVVDATWRRCSSDPKEVDQLFRDLLIGVTALLPRPGGLRVPGARGDAAAVREQGGGRPGAGLGPGLRHRRGGVLARHPPARARPDRLAEPPQVQVFATDIDAQALESARQACYPEAIAEQVSPERLERFFVQARQPLPGREGDPGDVPLLARTT